MLQVYTLNTLIKNSLFVKLSILFLIFLSIISWTIIIYKYYIYFIVKKKTIHFEKKFWSGIELSNIYQNIKNKHSNLNITEKIFSVGFKEFIRLFNAKSNSSNNILKYVKNTMFLSKKIELSILENSIALLGTIGSISPYIGLFGTVWSIMSLLTKIGELKQLSNIVQIVAPGISEALTSTAIGLFVSIPSIIAFNDLNIKLNQLNERYENFIEEFISVLYRQVYINRNIKNIDK